jgi:hypothetical protein
MDVKKLGRNNIPFLLIRDHQSRGIYCQAADQAARDGRLQFAERARGVEG